MQIIRTDTSVNIVGGIFSISLPFYAVVALSSRKDIIELKAEGFTYDINWTNVVTPAVASRDELYNLLISEYFIPSVTVATLEFSNMTVTENNPLPTLAHIEGMAPNGAHERVSVSAEGYLNVNQKKDLFGRIKTSDPQTVWDFTRIFPQFIPLFWSDFSTGSASNTHVKGTSSSILGVGVGGIMATQLKTRVKYQPGKEHETLLTGTFTPESGVEKYVGLFDLDSYADATVDGGIQNGVCLVVGATDADIHLQLYNEKIKKINVVRADWNIDKLDGTGASGITLDLDYSQIFGIALEWLGVGSVVYVLNIYGANVPLHQVDNANFLTQGVYMRTANLSPAYMIKSVGGVGSMEVICNTVISGGGHNPVGLPSYIASATGQAVAAGTKEGVLFVRLQPDSYEANVDLKGLSVLNATSGDTRVEVLFNPAWSGGGLTWINKPYSHLQYAFGAGDNLITNSGVGLECSLFAAANNALEGTIDSKLRLGKNLQANANQTGRYDVICLAISNLSNAQETYQFALKFLEIL